jgi:hypothetical protein
LWLKLLPVLGVKTGDGTAGIFQQNFAARDLQHHKTAIRLVMVNAPDSRLLIGSLFAIHLDVPRLAFWSLHAIVWMNYVSGLLPGCCEQATGIEKQESGRAPES